MQRAIARSIAFATDFPLRRGLHFVRVLVISLRQYLRMADQPKAGKYSRFLQREFRVEQH
jgi:hypothetical protein